MTSEELTHLRSGELSLQQLSRQPLPTPRDIISILFRQRLPILIAFSLVVIAATLTGAWTPKYEAHMKILAMHQRSDSMVTPSANAPAQYTSDQISEEDLNSEVELLKSDDLLRKVVLSTDLNGTSTLPPGPSRETRIASAVGQLGSALKIEPLKKTNMISVSYESRDPNMTEAVLKALSVAFIEKHMELHRSSGELKFFDQQTAQYKQNLDQAQARLTGFSKGTGVVSAELERTSALQQADAFDSTARQAQASLVETEQRVLALQSELQTIKPRMTTVVRSSDNSALLEQLKSTLLNLELKRTELLTKYEPTYPLVREVDQQISETKSALDAEDNKPVRDESSDKNPDYQWVQAELTKDQAELSGLKARAAAAADVAAKYHAQAQSLDQSMVTQQNLEQDAKTQEDNYLLYEHKREEARISDALDQGGILNVAIAEQPVVPALPKQSPLNVALLTFLLAGTCGLTTAFVVDFMDPTFRTPDELVGYLGAPVLAALSKGGE